MGIAFWRRAESCRDDACLLIARQQFLHRWLRSLNAVERVFKPALNQALPNFLDRSCPTRKRIGDPLIGPISSIRVGFQQDLRTPHLLARPLQLFDNALEFASLLIRQPHDISLLHGTPPCAMQNRRFVQT